MSCDVHMCLYMWVSVVTDMDTDRHRHKHTHGHKNENVHELLDMKFISK